MGVPEGEKGVDGGGGEEQQKHIQLNWRKIWFFRLNGFIQLTRTLTLHTCFLFKSLNFKKEEKTENFVGRKNRLFSNERELDSPWATLEPGRQWTGKGGAASSIHPAKMSLTRHGKRKTFQTCEDTKHTLSIKRTRGKYPVKFCIRRTVRAELLRKGKWRVQETEQQCNCA